MTLVLPDSRVANGLTVHERFLRSTLWLACFLLTTLTATPFPDLGDQRLLDPIGDGNRLGQILVIVLTLTLGAFVLAKARWVIPRAFTPALVLTLGWFAVTAVLSAHSDLALRRLVLAVFTVINATAFLVLPTDREHFGRLLASGALIILAISYLGVLLLPHLSIHQVTDVIESALAGAWRGPFGHKNGAGSMMVVLIFIGIFVARAVNLTTGLIIIAGATVFLSFTTSKSPIGLLPLVLLLSFALLRLRSAPARYTLVVGSVLVANLLTVGTVAIEPVGHLIAAFTPDATYTGRDEIWLFAIDNVLKKPITGFGFQAFWGTGDLLFNWGVNESWGLRASDAHNGYLNIAVMTGLTGLALTLVWTVLQPLGDLSAGRRHRLDPALTTLFVQIWIFGLLLSSVESVLFSGGDALWLLMIASIIGLRLQRVSQLSR
ncbi:MAG: O-antigen ligase [Alphaproteobacteria bacterium]